MLNSREADVRSMIEGRCSLSEGPAMFERMATGEIQAVKIIVEI